MSYIDLINAFEKWLETNYLLSSAQLLWYKLIAIFNRAGWCEWVTVDNRRLMSVMQIDSEKTLIRLRDKLVECNFFEYQKGKKGCPNRYKISLVNFPQIAKKLETKNESTLYDYFIKKYSTKEKNFYEQNKIISEMRNDPQWDNLQLFEQLSLQTKIFV